MRSLKLKNRLTTEDFFKHYKYYSQPKSVHHVKEYAVYKAVLKDFFTELSRMIIEEAYDYKIPHGLGHLYAKKYKNVGRPIDWYNTRKYGKTIYHNNFHSGGYGTCWKWSKRGILAKGAALYKFEATRTNKRNLAKTVKYSDIYKDYKEV